MLIILLPSLLFINEFEKPFLINFRVLQQQQQHIRIREVLMEGLGKQIQFQGKAHFQLQYAIQSATNAGLVFQLRCQSEPQW